MPAMAVVVAVMLFVFMTLILFLGMLPGFFKGRYARKIKRAIKGQGFNDVWREQFAQEQMAARGRCSIRNNQVQLLCAVKIKVKIKGLGKMKMCMVKIA